MSRRILVVDDEPNIRLSFRYGLLSDEWEVEEASSGADAVAKVLQSSFDLILLDLRMPPGLDGIQVLQKLNEHQVRIPAIMVSAHATTDTVIQAIQRGTLDFLTKPVTPEQLRSAIREVLERFDFGRAHQQGGDGKPLSDDDKLKLAKYYVFERRYDEAAELFRQLGEGIHQEEALLMLGILNEISGDFAAAEARYVQVLKPAASSDAWKDSSSSRWLFEHLSGG